MITEALVQRTATKIAGDHAAGFVPVVRLVLAAAFPSVDDVEALDALPVRTTVSWSKGVARRLLVTDGGDDDQEPYLAWCTPGGTRLTSHNFWTYVHEHRADDLFVVWAPTHLEMTPAEVAWWRAYDAAGGPE